MEELLLADPLVNMFLLGYMDAVPIPRAYWYGAVDGDHVRGLVLVVPGRLAVPWAPDLDDAARIGALLSRRHRPSMVVGPREASDAMWGTWAPDADVDRWHDQRLYVCEQAPEGDPLPGFRHALHRETPLIAQRSAAMEREDIGSHAMEIDPEGYLDVVRRRIERGQTWVWERDGELIFQINVGTVTTWGIQVGGTYVPDALRGQGIATAGMIELVRRLVPKHRSVTLHVNEANLGAVRAYERSGFTPHVPYRLITLKPDL